MLESLLTEIRQCTVCEPHLPLGANPVIRAHPAAKILIIGQAPGTKCTKPPFRGMMPAVSGCVSGWV